MYVHMSKHAQPGGTATMVVSATLACTDEDRGNSMAVRQAKKSADEPVAPHHTSIYSRTCALASVDQSLCRTHALMNDKQVVTFADVTLFVLSVTSHV